MSKSKSKYLDCFSLLDTKIITSRQRHINETVLLTHRLILRSGGTCSGGKWFVTDISTTHTHTEYKCNVPLPKPNQGYTKENEREENEVGILASHLVDLQ